MNRIIGIIGPSGSGKTTLAKALEAEGINPLVSFTTRPIREGETDGVDYHFLSMEEIPFEQLIEQTEYNGNFYGLLKDEVEQKLERGHVCFVCDRAGFQSLQETYENQTVAVWLETRPSVCYNRMKERGDSEDAILSRMSHAIEEKEFLPPAFAHYTLNAEASIVDSVHFIKRVILR